MVSESFSIRIVILGGNKYIKIKRMHVSFLKGWTCLVCHFSKFDFKYPQTVFKNDRDDYIYFVDLNFC